MVGTMKKQRPPASSSRKVSFMALFAVVAPLLSLQLYLLGMVKVPNINTALSMNDYLLGASYNENSVSSSNVVDDKSTSSGNVMAVGNMNTIIQRNTAANEIFVLEKQHKSNGALQPNTKILSPKNLFAKMPNSQKHTFYIPCGKACHPMIRALRVLGWTRVNTIQEAQLVYTYNSKKYDKEKLPRQLDEWQRYNAIMSSSKFDTFFDKVFSSALPFTVETYNLSNKAGIKELQERLGNKEDLGGEWVLRYGKVRKSVVQPKSYDIKAIEKKGGLVQKAVCNEMTWNKRQFDVRVFWMIASTEPLIAFYIDGWARIGPVKNESKKSIEVQDTEESFDSLASMLRQNYKGGTITDPMMHVRNQMKQALGEVAAQFLNNVKLRDSLDTKAKDAYEFYSADFTIDQDLNVWLTNLEQETKLGEDYYFRLALNHNVNYGMALILQEIWEKQQEGLPLFPLTNNGLWEAVYADGWKFKNDDSSKTAMSKVTC